MDSFQGRQVQYEALRELFQDERIRSRSFFQGFAQEWQRLFEKALRDEECYLSGDSDAVLAAEQNVFDINIKLHFDQLKIYDWFQQEQKRGKRVVFCPEKLKRSRKGVLSFKDESICSYDPAEPETALSESMRNIVACALPGLPPELRVVYGNKWVNSRFTILRQSSLSLFLIQTDFVPAFLADAFEVCTYLFLMDCCIIMENHTKVADHELQKLLHIFRPSPMLLVKKLIETPREEE